MTTIFLVQHGDKERLPGDPGLTELGRRQAEVTARWLRGAGLQAVYSSPLRRARETAEPVGQATGLAVQVDSRLRERLNWDGTQALMPFGPNGTARPRTATWSSATVNPHGRRENACGSFSPAYLAAAAG